jgi:hypothetical protein
VKSVVQPLHCGRWRWDRPLNEQIPAVILAASHPTAHTQQAAIAMVRITIDEETRKKLFSTGDDVVELFDESGKLLGRVLPHRGDPLAGWTPITPELSEEELDRLSNANGPTMTTEELIAYLKRPR